MIDLIIIGLLFIGSNSLLVHILHKYKIYYNDPIWLIIELMSCLAFFQGVCFGIAFNS